VVLSHAEILSARLRTRDEIFSVGCAISLQPGFWGAQAAGLLVSAACRDPATGAPWTLLLKEFSGIVARQPQFGSLRPQNASVPR
jgi:hypothetical protein